LASAWWWIDAADWKPMPAMSNWFRIDSSWSVERPWLLGGMP